MTTKKRLEKYYVDLTLNGIIHINIDGTSKEDAIERAKERLFNLLNGAGFAYKVLSDEAINHDQ